MSTASLVDRPQPSAVGRLRRRRFAIAVALGGFALSVVAFYPGLLPSDALDQFKQGRDFRFTDWHPPIMALWWWALDHVWVGPTPMLLIQVSAFWLAGYALLTLMPPSPPRALRWGIAAALFSPVVLNFIGVIAKDVQLGACWVLAATACYRRRTAGEEPPVLERVLCLILVSYGALTRQNSALVAGPLVLYVLIGRGAVASAWRTVMLWTIVGVGYMSLGVALNAALQAENSHVLRGLLDFDLAGISLRTGENAFPFPVSPDEMRRIAACYEGGTRHDNLVWGDCAFVWQRALASASTEGSYVRVWLAAISQHPWAYALHRLIYFMRLAGLVTLQPAHAFWIDGTSPNDLGFSTHPNVLFYAVKVSTYAALATPLLRIGFWIAAAMALLAWSRRHPDCGDPVRRFAFVAAISSLAYIFTNLPFGVAAEFRYAYPAILLVTFGWCAVAMAYFAERATDRQSRWGKSGSGAGLGSIALGLPEISDLAGLKP